MATKKSKQGKADKKPHAAGSPPSTASEPKPADDDVRRLLRTAAWSRMFGRTSGAKNPFTR